MKKHKAKYTKGFIGKIKIVDDFLPKPKDLVLKAEIKKLRKGITLGKKLSVKKMREKGRK